MCGVTESFPRAPAEAPRLERAVCLALLLLSAALALHHVSGDAATADEPVHVAASVEIVRDGTGRWNPEHPPLAKALAGLALTGLPLRAADDPLRSAAGPGRLARFLYANETPPETVLRRARLPFVALLAALLLAVRAEARRRWGPWAGCAALAFAALEPNLNAHAGVVHTDLAVTLFVVLSLGPLARLVRPGERSAAPLLGLFWGLALLSKFSAPLLALATLPFLAVDTIPSRRDLPRLLGRVAAAAGIALVVALVGFGWAYRNQSAEDRRALAVDRLEVKGRSPAAARLALSAGDALPPAGNLLTGALSVALQSEVGAGVNYFLGTVSREGSPWYFPVALAVKTPLGLLLGLAAALAAGGGRRFAAVAGASLLLFLVFSARTTYNIGVRHALFAYPLLAIAAGSALAGARSSREPGSTAGGAAGRLPRGAALGGLLVLALEIATVHPHELSFFNAGAGGLAGGRRLFADSNLDWGQDLLRLKESAPSFAPNGLGAVVFGGDLPSRHGPALRPPFVGEEDRPGALLALGEAPFALGPELLRSKGAVRDAERLERIREAVRARGTRIGSIGGSIGIWRIDRAP
jgi:4-amino-4-deoxy-L-arabinose transferase-like glycosyltransferase